MIVKNEGEILGRCLESIRGAADEIVIVDTGSTDSTVAVAESFGARVIFEQWSDDFARARNTSLQHATSEWVLWLDADDVVPAESVPQITALKSTKPDRVVGFTIRNERPGNTGSEFVQARMFPNRADIFFERRIHEQMMPSALRLGLSMEKRDIVIEHHGYADPVTLRAKAERNVKLLLQEYSEESPDPVLAVEIGDSYQLIEDNASASSWYQKVIDMPASAQMPAIASQAFLGLGNICNRNAEHVCAVAHLEKAMALTPWRADVLYSLAVAQELSGNIEGSVSSLRAIAALNAVPGQVGVDFRSARIKAWLRLLRILAEQGRTDEALVGAADALALHPDRPEICNIAAKVFLKMGKPMDALHTFEKSLQIAIEGNLDAYCGLCLIYRVAKREQVGIDTIRSIEPLFGTNPRYWAFRRLFTGTNELSPFGDTDGILSEHHDALWREFLGVEGLGEGRDLRFKI